MAKTSIANAKFIDTELRDALEYLTKARKAIARAEAAIDSGENEPAMKTPTLTALRGSLTIASSSLMQESNAWNGYARARESR